MRSRQAALSKSGYVPRIALWGARALYVGPAFGLSAHRNAVAVIAVGLAAPFGVANDPRDPERGYRPCNVALIPPNTLHHLRPSDPMAFIYLEAASRDDQAALASFAERYDEVAFGHARETALRDALHGHLTQTRSWPQTRAALDHVLGLSSTTAIDPRIAAALAQIDERAADDIDAADLAREAGLSVSRFLHLFQSETGLPFRRYRLWRRLAAAVRAAQAGASLTTAAHAAGLAGSAHLSTAFRDMFGLAPTDLDLPALHLIVEP